MKQHLFELNSKAVIGTAIFDAPYRAQSTLDHEARFVHITNGQSKLYLPDNQLDLKTSDCFLMKCDNFVNNWIPNKDGLKSQATIIQLTPDTLQYIYKNEIPDFLQKPSKTNTPPASKIKPSALMDQFISVIQGYFQNPELVSDDLVVLKLKELIHILMHTEQHQDIKIMLGDLFHTNAYELKEVVHAHIFDDVSIEDLAFFSGMSLSTFKRKFKTVFNSSPTQYINTKRIERAEYLLRTSSERISDIAYDCGFNDIGYFSKMFKTKFNQSPSEYRKVS